MSTEADIVTPEMLRDLVTSDHKRGCQGREYGCSCGYDDNKDRMIERAADALEKLRAERDAAARDMREQALAAVRAEGQRIRNELATPPNVRGLMADDHALRFANNTTDRILAAIYALPDTPAVMAKSGKDAT